MTAGQTNYDDLAYPNYVFPDTHPSRLAAIGKFFGLACPNSDKAKVLEIGCAGGLNILSHAASLPNASFFAIDSSSTQIKSALELQKLSGISNVKFECAKLESLDNSIGKFDYIICHGVFSWVPQHVQHDILKLCRTLLSNSGIAFVSYNTLPGWHIQNILRDALLYRSQDVTSSNELASTSKDFLRFVKDLFPKSAKSILNPTIEHLLEVSDNYLAHEHLGEVNHALYFHQFTDLCQQHGLMYLAESELGSMIPKEFEPNIQDKIAALAKGSLSKMEQYCDFLRLRQFRKTLICRDDCKPNRHLDPNRLLPLFISASKTHKGSAYRSKGELKGSMLESLDLQFPKRIAVQEIVSQISNTKILSQIMEQVMVDSIEIRDTACPFETLPSEHLKLSPLAQSLIPYGNTVPNLNSDTVALDPILYEKLKLNKTLSDKDLNDLGKLGLLLRQ